MKTHLRPNPKLEIRRSQIHGWGVFTRKKIRAGEVLEEVPFVRLSMSSTALESVRYYWPREEPWECLAIPAGFAMLYNHSDIANADWETLGTEQLFRFVTLCDIQADDEILIHYGENYSW